MEDKKVDIVMLILIIVLFLSIVLLFKVVGDYFSKIVLTPKNDRFKTISREIFREDIFIEILYDKETKVKYVYLEGSRRTAITVLLDAEGKPLLYQGD